MRYVYTGSLLRKWVSSLHQSIWPLLDSRTWFGMGSFAFCFLNCTSCRLLQIWQWRATCNMYSTKWNTTCVQKSNNCFLMTLCESINSYVQAFQMRQFLTIQSDITVQCNATGPCIVMCGQNLVEEQNLLLLVLTPSMPSLWRFAKWTSLVEGLIS